MADYITLLGAEEVSRAASNMSSAAADMQRAASTMQSAFDQQERFMNDWLSRLDGILQDRTCDLVNQLPR
jgi:hypothetical protein